MMKPPIGTALKSVLLPLVVAMPIAVMAQSVVHRAEKPYSAKPTIEFVFAATAAATAATAEAPLFSFVEPVPPPVPAPIAPTLKLEKGKRVDKQLLAYGKETGWDIDWQAPEFVLDKDMLIPGDFESALVFFLKGANEAGSRLRAVFYRGNKTVRVMEF